MVEAGSGGSIINVSTMEAVRAAPGFAAYAAAKAGVVNFTKTAALELAPHGIRVNGLAPDFTLTESRAKMAPAGAENARLMVPMGRAGHVDEMAGAAVFLASDLSAYVTGQTLHVDGGTAAAGGWYHHPQNGHYILGRAGPHTRTPRRRREAGITSPRPGTTFSAGRRPARDTSGGGGFGGGDRRSRTSHAGARGDSPTAVPLRRRDRNPRCRCDGRSVRSACAVWRLRGGPRGRASSDGRQPRRQRVRGHSGRQPPHRTRHRGPGARTGLGPVLRSDAR